MMSRLVRSLTVLFVAALLAPMFNIGYSSARGAQVDGTPVVDQESDDLRSGLTQPTFIEADGIESSVLAQAGADELPDDSVLLLERLSVAPGGGLPPHTSTATEVLVVSEGAVTIADSFGFSATTSAGQALTFAPDSSYELTNTGAEAAVVLRLGTSTGETADTDDADVIAPSGASPVAVPVEDPDSEVLLSQPIADPPSGPIELFIASAVFEPGATSGELAHSGPLGLVIESGALDVLSPSGLVGQLAEGAAVVLPETAPLVATNNGASDTSVLFVGVIPSGESLLTEITPTPAPTVPPPPTLEPTATPTPEPTVEPTATSEPTATPTPEPTSTPEPTATPTPTPTPIAAGTILYEANTSGGFEEWSGAGGWQSVSGMLVNDGSSGSPAFAAAPFQVPEPNYAVEVELQWSREGSSFGTVVRGGDDGGYWIGYGNTCHENWNLAIWSGAVPLEPSTGMCGLREGNLIYEEVGADLDSEWHLYRIEVQGNSIRVFIDGTEVVETSDNRYLTPGEVGVWSQDGQVSIRRFSVIALGNEANASGGDGVDSVTSMAADQEVDVSDLLPSVADVPDELVETGRRSRTLAELAENYSDAAETTQLFTSWGWRENAISSFALPSGQQAGSGEVNGVYASVHRFSEAANARAALDFSLTEQAAGTALGEVTTRQFGEYSRALYGPTDYGNEITLLTQQGDFFIRLSVAMLDGDPTFEAEPIMEGILARAAQGGSVQLASVDLGAWPAAFSGSWVGSAVQANPDVEWPFTIALTGGNVGAVVGATDYPTYECGGDLYLAQASVTAIVMTEPLTYGQDACTGDGSITLTMRADGDLDFAWTGVRTNGTSTSASGTLTKA